VISTARQKERKSPVKAVFDVFRKAYID